MLISKIKIKKLYFLYNFISSQNTIFWNIHFMFSIKIMKYFLLINKKTKNFMFSFWLFTWFKSFLLIDL